MRFAIILALLATDVGALMPEDDAKPVTDVTTGEGRPLPDLLTALETAATADEQTAAAEALWSSCFSVQMQLRDASTGEPVAFADDWPGRVGTLEVRLTCDGRTRGFRPLAPDPVWRLMRE